MKNGELSKEQKIANRYFLINSLEDIIKESVYYRNHSNLFIEDNKIGSLNIKAQDIRLKLL